MANGRSGTVSQIDTRNGERLAADIRVDAGPAALAVTDTDVWVANEGGQSVSRISRTTRQVAADRRRRRPVVGRRVGDDVWVANRYSGTISRIDTRTNAVDEDRRPQRGERAGLGRRRALGRREAASPAAEHRGGTLVWEGTEPRAHRRPGVGLLRLQPGPAPVRVRQPDRLPHGQRTVLLGLVPDLATDLPEPTDGGRTYVFTIRPGIRYSTGAEVRASDFYRGMQRALQPTAENPASAPGGRRGLRVPDSRRRRGQGCDLSRGVVADDTAGRLTIRLTEPDSELLEKLALLLFPAPVGTPMADQVWTPLPATGPYAVTAAGPDGVTLTRNPYFRQWSAAARPDGYPDVITWRRSPRTPRRSNTSSTAARQSPSPRSSRCLPR